MRVHVVFTLLLFGLAAASRLRSEAVEAGTESVGWQRWWRQLLHQNRDKVIVFAQGSYGIFPLAEFVLLLGVKPKDVPPWIGTHQEIRAKYRLTSDD